jgi:sodium/proline symporter
MGLVSNAWSGFGATFGALILLSLYGKRVNRAGAAAGIISGGLSVIIWDYLSFGGKTLAASTGLYSLAPGFLISLIFIVVVSLMTKEPSKEIQDEFDKAMNSATFE